MKKALSFLGILNRGGRLVFGPAIENALGRLSLLIVANDAAGKDKMSVKAQNRGVPTLSQYGKEELGQALGYDELSYVGILGKKEAKAFLEKAKE